MKMLAWVKRNWALPVSILLISGLAYAATPSTPVGVDNIPLFTVANPGIVSASITPSGTQNVNLTQVAGVAVAQGNGAAATAIRVSLPTDGTGVVGLNAGSAIIGNVRIDQTTPGTTNNVTTTSVQASATARGGAITAGGTAQTLAASNASRKGIIIQNPCSATEQGIATAENLYINLTSAATVSTNANLVVIPPCSSFSMGLSAGLVSTELISVNAATTAHIWYAKEF